MKLIGCIFVGNEKLMVKYVMPYLKYYNYDKLYLYDNSTDGTIDLIKSYNYPFIEIIDAHDISNLSVIQDYEAYRRKIEVEFFEKLKKETKETGEEIWFSFMDFDEIVFVERYINNGYKMYLWELSISEHVNYYAAPSAQLVSGYETCEELDTVMEKQHQKLVHGINGMDCIAWSYWGTKVSSIKVNDFERFYFDDGNHCGKGHMENGVAPINAYDFGNFFTFHLKFLTKEHYMYKMNTMYVNRYNCTSLDFEEEYFYRMISTKFPVNLVFYDDFLKHSYQCKGIGFGNIGGLTLV